MGSRLLIAALAAAVALGPARMAWAWPGEPVWAAKPSAEDEAKARPATEPTAVGSAAVRCRVDAQGLLSECTLLRDYPAGFGYGAALLSLLPKYRLDPRDIRRSAPDGQIVVAMTWGRYDRHATWLRTASVEGMLLVYPRDALARGRRGTAILNCLASTEGVLFDCLVERETPPGEHFGEAGLALMPQFLITPATIGNVPVVQSVTLPIHFQGGANFPGPPERLISASISWAAAPTVGDMAAAYPAEAAKARVPGHTVLLCGFARDGTLKDCSILSQAPDGRGFGAAALNIAKLFRLDLAELDKGALSSLRVSLPVTFAPGVIDGMGDAAGKPEWTEAPDAAALAAGFASVKPSTRAGRALLTCDVRQGGGLADCAVKSEDPPASGLGQLGLALQSRFRVATWTEEGLPVIGAPLTAPMRFAAPDPASTPRSGAQP